MANKKKSEKSGREVGRRSLATRPSSRGTGVVRISAGMWRQSPLAVPDAVGLRPTPDRVRGTLFDWVRHLLGDLAGCRVLDLFAGSGVSGLVLMLNIVADALMIAAVVLTVVSGVQYLWNSRDIITS